MKQNILLSAAAIALVIALMASGCKTVTNPPDNNPTITPGWSAGNFGTNETILGVTFPSPSVGYACGFNGTLLKTVDSGKTWTALNTSTTGGTNIYRISFRDVNTGVAGGNNATLIRTTDGGMTWSTITTSMPGDDNIRDISYVGSKIIVVGGIGNGEGFVYTSADNGVTWQDAKEGTGTIYSIAVQSSNAFTVSGISGQIYSTNDFGNTWSDESVDAPGDDFMATDFLDASHGTTVSYYGTIYSSSDAGLIWSSQSSGLNSNSVNGGDGLLRTVKMLSGSEAWAAGQQGILLHTTNGGVVWTQTSIGGTSGISWNQIAQRDPHTLAFVGDNGTLYWYTF